MKTEVFVFLAVVGVIGMTACLCIPRLRREIREIALCAGGTDADADRLLRGVVYSYAGLAVLAALVSLMELV